MCKNKIMSKTRIADIYEGENLQVWKDEEFVTLSIGLTCISIPLEVWDDFKEDLKELVKVLG